MNLKFRSLFSALLYLVLFAITLGCQSDGSDDPTLVDPELEKAQLKDFQLSEVPYLDIKIVHPELSGGKEVKAGEIEITIPYTQKSLLLSLKAFDLDSEKYSIVPSIGLPTDFSNGPVVYAIHSNFYANKAVHYNVKVVYGGEPLNENTKITGFKFEKSKNPGLDATVEAIKIVEYTDYSENAIYVIVPVGTDFSNLTPTITYDAAKLYYTVDNEFKLYPESGMSVDFKYPKHFHLQAINSYGEKSLVYRVIVDVSHPIKFEHSVLTTPNVKTGGGVAPEYFTDIATWTNQGNYPVTGMAANGYINKEYPLGGPIGEVNIITANLLNPVPGTRGVLPGESGTINVKVSRATIAGQYKTTVVFKPTFNFDTSTVSYLPVGNRIEEIFESPVFTIETILED